MSNLDITNFNADELNQAIDDTNFPNAHPTKDSDGIKREKTPSMPLPVTKQNGQNGVLSKSYSDDVFGMPSTPKTPRSITTPGNHCE